jgi:phosphatidylinositol-3-phosphatase
MKLRMTSGRRVPGRVRPQHRRPRVERVVLVAALLVVGTACQGPSGDGTPAPGPSTTATTGSSTVPTSAAPSPTDSPLPTAAAAGKIGHVFVINLENQSYDKTWGPDSAAPYLSQTLRSQGVLLTQYYGVAHHSNPNYLAQISGQASNPMTRNDCTTYAPFVQTGTADPGQVLGSGCVYPASVPTLAGQLSNAGKTWKGYMEDMGTACRHPNPGAKDTSQNAKINDQYATRHNPFVYFASITSSTDCQNNVVDYSNLAKDLQSAATTPNLAYISPNLCHDGHDSPCVDGQPGGLESADAWLKEQVPAILNSPAYRQDGALVITFDEADGNATGPSGLPGGTAGGLIGALVLSPFSSPGTTSGTMYNHYSLLATMEDIFAVPRLGYAGAPGLRSFGRDVFNTRL